MNIERDPHEFRAYTPRVREVTALQWYQRIDWPGTLWEDKNVTLYSRKPNVAPQVFRQNPVPYVLGPHEEKLYLVEGYWIVTTSIPDRYIVMSEGEFQRTYEPSDRVVF